MAAYLNILMITLVVVLTVDAQRPPGRGRGRGRDNGGGRHGPRLPFPGFPEDGDAYDWTLDVDAGTSELNQTAVALSVTNAIIVKPANRGEASDLARALVFYTFSDVQSDSVMAVRLLGGRRVSSVCYLFDVGVLTFTDAVAVLDAMNGTTVSVNTADAVAYDGTVSPLSWVDRVNEYMKNPSLLLHCGFRRLVRPTLLTDAAPVNSLERVVSSLPDLMAIYVPEDRRG